MEKRLQKFTIGLAAITVITFGLGKFFDSRCGEKSCVGEAFAANTEGLKELEKYHIYLDDKNANITFKDNGENVHISIGDEIAMNADDDSADRQQNPLTETFAAKDLKKLSIKSYVTDWKVTDSVDDQVHFIFKDYLPSKEWTLKESKGSLELETHKTGPLEAEVQLPKNFSGQFQLSNVSGDVTVEKLAKTAMASLATVSGSLEIAAASHRKFMINTVSGNVTLDPGTVNKDMTIEYISVSGDLESTLNGPLKKFKTKSVSGDVTLKVKKAVSFTFDLEVVSGDFEGLPPGTKEQNGFGHHTAKGAFGADPKGEFSFNSVSGDFNLQSID